MIRAALAYAFYRFLGFPLLSFFVQAALPFLKPKMRELLMDRRDRHLPPLLSRPIWIHAASGEVEYAKPVIREIKARYPELPILLTYFSPSAKKLFKNFPGIDLAIPLPFDRPSEVRAFLDFYKPRAGLFARTDVWPNFATIAHDRGLPMLLFAATFGAQSSRLGWGRASLARWVFSRFSKIYCVSEMDAENLRQVSQQLPIEVRGDTRYDQVFDRLEKQGHLNEELAPGENDFVVIAGSTWPEDEAVLLPAFSKLLEEGARIVLIPHEVGESRLRNIEENLASLQVSCQRFSETTHWRQTSVLLVDQIGKLADLYRWGDVAFVGGSFRKQVHSVMEPLAAGLPVVVGPFHQNNREAVQFQSVFLSSGEAAVRKIETTAEFSEQVRFWKQNGPVHPELSECVRTRTGATQAVVDWLRHSLFEPEAGL